MCLACHICMLFLFKCLLLSANVSCSSQMYVFVSNVYCLLEVCLACHKRIFYQMSVACWKCVLLVTNVFFYQMSVACWKACDKCIFYQMSVACWKCVLLVANVCSLYEMSAAIVQFQFMQCGI